MLQLIVDMSVDCAGYSASLTLRTGSSEHESLVAHYFWEGTLPCGDVMEDSPWVVRWTHLLALSIILGRGLALRRRDGGFTMGCAVETPLGWHWHFLLHHQYYHYFPSLHHQYYE